MFVGYSGKGNVRFLKRMKSFLSRNMISLKTQIATCRTTWAWTRMIQVWLKPVQTHSLAICFVSTVFHCQPSLFFGGGSWPDPTVVIEADGEKDKNKLLRTITWPEMDSDALPSSYITRVLTCTAKWNAKLLGLCDTIAGFGAAPDHVTEFLHLNHLLI